MYRDPARAWPKAGAQEMLISPPPSLIENTQGERRQTPPSPRPKQQGPVPWPRTKQISGNREGPQMNYLSSQLEIN